MADGSYDNSNSGVFFMPYDDQHLFGQGKLNIDGRESHIVVVRERLTRDGDLIPVVYQRLGPLFPNDKKGNDKAPDRSGPMDTHPDHRMAVWAGEKEGRKYFSMKVSRKQSEGSGNSSGSGGTNQDDGWGANGGMADDEIPF